MNDWELSGKGLVTFLGFLLILTYFIVLYIYHSEEPVMSLKTYLCEENSSGDLYIVTADSKDDGVYRVFGSEIYKMKDAFDKGFDAGNVDINVLEIKPKKKCGVTEVSFD